MKVFLISDAGNIHTKRWASALADAGIRVVLYSITPADESFYERKGISLHVFDLFSYKRDKTQGRFAPVANHIKALKTLKKLLRSEKPDILHAHYATSYGLIAALSGFHPLIVSVWGSDVYEFPRLSEINRLSVEFTLAKADRVLSTSRVMAEETKKYYKGDIGITPFGVDTEKFRPETHRRNAPEGQDREFVFGTVKTLSEKYGIDLLLKAFAETAKILGNEANLRLIIAGKGKDRKELETLAEELGISDRTDFVGAVEHDSVPELYSRMDAAVFLSREESFGVAAAEAMACGCPVIASDAAGFMEILSGGAGIMVPREDFMAAAEAMARLVRDSEERERLSEAGRKRVLERYDWKDNVETMIGEYRRLAGKGVD